MLSPLSSIKTIVRLSQRAFFNSRPFDFLPVAIDRLVIVGVRKDANIVLGVAYVL